MLARIVKICHSSTRRLSPFSPVRYFSEIEDFEGNDNFESGDEKGSIVKKDFKYKFNQQTLAFVVDSPLFVYKSKSLYVGKKKVDILKSLLLSNEEIFGTAILPRDLAQIVQPNNSTIDKTIFIEINEKNKKKSLEVLEQFHPVGSYCSIAVQDDLHISLRCLHKAKFSKLTQINLGELQETTHDQLRQFYDKHQVESHVLTESDHRSIEDNQLSKKRNQTPGLKDDFKKMLVPENILHISENDKNIYPHYNSLDIETRVKVDYLVETNKKLMAGKIPESSVINYYDLETFLDGIGTILSDTNFFTYDEITALFAAETITQGIDLSIEYIKRYITFATKMTDIKKIVDQNLQIRRLREQYNEMYNTVKRMVESSKKSPLKILEEAFIQKNPPEHIIEIFQENYKKLSTLDKNHSEYAVLKNYIETVAHLPFGTRSKDNFDLDRARDVLNKSHYGLEDVKKRILEFLAVGKLTGGVKGKILCLQGPPGVGKTSFAFSVAEALERKVYRISMGGESDVSVLKGHRKTYIGSKPGKIVAALKECQTENCVIIIDEVDKIGKNYYTGDPQSTLLEVLDPEQNNTFVDNYLDFPIDLSNVFFICTANTLSRISPPLLDRMDVISISSYTNVDKEKIFKDFMINGSIKENGLLTYKDKFEIKDEIIEKLINSYCRDPGIRSLQKYAARLIERLAYDLLKQEENSQNTSNEAQLQTKITIDVNNLHKYIGQPIYERDNLYQKMVPGVIQGLAYSETGGSVLFVEASLGSIKKYAKGLKVTGNLGDVMKESIKIAYSFSRHFLMEQHNNFLEEYLVHVHVPEGATPKDGPSAGIAITSALISLSMNRPINKNFTMTGEISLKGKVMKIGGLKEKILAAKREKLTDIIVPEDNREDVEFLTDDVKGGLRLHFVEFYKDVFNLLFQQEINS